MKAGTLSQDQMDELYSTCLDAAANLLEKNGEFFPIAFEWDAGGQIRAVAVMEEEDHPPSQQVIDSLLYVLREHAASGQIIASAMAVDIRVRREPGKSPIDAVQVRLRGIDYVRDVIVPYTVESSGFFRRKRALHFDAPYAQAAENDVFS